MWTNIGMRLDKILNNERFHVMQFTGLQDKNGKEIYEGDVIQGYPCNHWVEHVAFSEQGDMPTRFLVYWDYAGFGFKALDGDTRYLHEHPHEHDKEEPYFAEFQFEPVMIEEKEVIGNIYENPELLA